MTRESEALALAEETLQLLEVDAARLTPVVLRCGRIARLIASAESQNYFQCELRGYSSSFAQGLPADEQNRFLAWSGRGAPPATDGTPMHYSDPIEVIETRMDLAREELRALQMPVSSISESAPAAGGQPRPFYEVPRISAAETILNTILTRRGQAQRTATTNTTINASVRSVAQDWLSGQVVSLKYGSVMSDALHRARASVDRALQLKAPAAAQALGAAFARGRSDDPEEWSQALTSCRRALKAIADVLFPARDEPIAGRVVDNDAYINRLKQFALEQVDSKSRRKVMTEDIDSVGRRADSLNALASKGTHATVAQEEFDLTVIRTYLLAGELLALAPEPSEPERTEPAEPPEEANSVLPAVADDVSESVPPA